MRTTLDLPPDIAATLRAESARRGGRAKASMTRLVAEAVRQAYGPKVTTAAPKIVARPGHGLVVMPPGITITSKDVAAALEETP